MSAFLRDRLETSYFNCLGDLNPRSIRSLPNNVLDEAGHSIAWFLSLSVTSA